MELLNLMPKMKFVSEFVFYLVPLIFMLCDIVMSTLSTDDFNSKHYGTWTVLKSETVGNKTVNYFLKTA